MLEEYPILLYQKFFYEDYVLVRISDGEDPLDGSYFHVYRYHPDNKLGEWDFHCRVEIADPCEAHWTTVSNGIFFFREYENIPENNLYTHNRFYLVPKSCWTGIPCIGKLHRYEEMAG